MKHSRTQKTILAVCGLLMGFSSMAIDAHAGKDTPAKEKTVWEILKAIVATQHQVVLNTQALYDTAQTQLAQAKHEWDSLSRAYDVIDSPDEQQARVWSAQEWRSLLQQAAGGNETRFQQLLASYQTQFPFITPTSPHLPTHRLVEATYTQQGQTYPAALATSEYTFDRIEPRIHQLEALLHRVNDPHQNPNPKAAIDLNSRISAELGFIQLELLRSHSIQTHLEAAHHQGEFSRDTLDKQFTHYQPNAGETP